VVDALEQEEEISRAS